MLNRAYSALDIKSIDAEQRVITGIATSATPDRVGDVVEPKGAQFQLPIPLLWQHDSKQPIGEVFAAKQTADGIEIKARIAQIDEPGLLKDRLDLAWQSISTKLVRGLSIGFKSLEESFDKKTGGFHFLKWLWLELSAVTIPANADATIQTIKHFDVGLPAASGTGARVDSSSPGASGSVVFVARKGAPAMKTITEQIAAFEAKRAASDARMSEIMTKSAEEGRTLNEDEKEEHDTLAAEVKDVDEHLVRLRAQEERNKAAAKPVTGKNVDEGTRSRGNTPTVSVKSNLDPGIEYARMVMCKMASFDAMMKGEFVSSADIAMKRYPDCPRIHNVLKATVGAAVTEEAGSPGSSWAAALVYQQNLTSEFIEFLRPQTIVGKIANLRRVPFNIRVIGQTTGGAGYWVGEGKPKPLTKFDFEPSTLLFTKLANIAVITQEAARFSSPSLEMLVRDSLAAAIIERMDIDFVDPNKASSDASPASITNGITPIGSSGTDPSAVRTDFQALFAAFIADNLNPMTATLIMPAATAMALSLMQNALGQPQFPGITMNGGTFMGLPVVTSQYVTDGSPGGAIIILVNASDIFLADDGQVTVDVSREASLEMSNAPTQDGGAGTGAQLVSLWQNNLMALRAERFVNWKRRRDEAVQYLSDVAYSATGSPS